MEIPIEDYQQIEKITGFLKRLAFLQYYPPESVGLRGRLIFAFMLYVAVQPAIAVIANWQHWSFNSRVSGIDNLIFSFGVFCLSADIFLMPEKTRVLLDIINSQYKMYSIDPEAQIVSEKIELVREKTLEGFRRSEVVDFIATKLYFLGYLPISIIGVYSYVVQLDKVENLPLLFLFYSPSSQSLQVTSFIEYLLLTLIQYLYIFYVAIVVTAVHMSQSLSINNVIIEMKIFHLSIKEIDILFENQHTAVKSDANRDAEDRLKNNNIILAMRRITRHHQTIFRKVKQLNDGLQFKIFTLNTYICLQICLGIFIFVKGEFLYKLKYGIIVITMIIFEYMFSENGQRLQNEGEQLRMDLYCCSWIDKPKWFTSTLQILMTRNNNLPKVSLFNIFTLNRDNMTVVMRGVYT